MPSSRSRVSAAWVGVGRIGVKLAPNLFVQLLRMRTNTAGKVEGVGDAQNQCNIEPGLRRPLWCRPIEEGVSPLEPLDVRHIDIEKGCEHRIGINVVVRAREQDVRQRGAFGRVALVEGDKTLNRPQVAQQEVVGYPPAVGEELRIDGINTGISRVAEAHITLLVAKIGPAVMDEGAVDAGGKIIWKIAPLMTNCPRVALIDELGGRIGVTYILIAFKHVQHLVGGDEGCVNARLRVGRGRKEGVADTPPNPFDRCRNQLAAEGIWVKPDKLPALEQQECTSVVEQYGIEVILEVQRKSGRVIGKLG